MGAFKSFVKGLVIGGGLALLFAPKPGKDLRKDLMQKADHAADRAKTYGDDLVEKGTIVVENVKETAHELKEDVTETVKVNKANAEEMLREASEKVEETVEETADDLNA